MAPHAGGPACRAGPASRVLTRAAATEVSESAAPATPPKLLDLEMRPILNLEGLVDPEVPAGAAAFVIAIFDERSRLQYVGFSADLRASLRTLFTRRPDKAYTYKAAPFPVLDQRGMADLRDKWFVEAGGAPPGNKLALERKRWQSPVDAGAISQRGKRGAAEDKLRELLALLKGRGFREEVVADEALMADGQVDFLPAAAQTDEARAAAAAARASKAQAIRTATAIVDGVARQFTVSYPLKFDTAGGVMLDARLMYDHQESMHRVIVGREWYEPANLPPEAVVEAALGVLLAHKEPRATTGLLSNAQFPCNYFAVSQMSQWYGQDFREAMEAAAGREVEGAKSWKFDRTWPSMHTIDSPAQLAGAPPAAAAAAAAEAAETR